MASLEINASATIDNCLTERTLCDVLGLPPALAGVYPIQPPETDIDIDMGGRPKPLYRYSGGKPHKHMTIDD